ncbi:MAG: mechanosensitive ion channel [Salibacteraceae bacterium]
MLNTENTLERILESPLLERFALILIGIVIVWIVNRYLNRALASRITSNENRYRARKATNFLAYMAIILVVLFTFSDKLGNIGLTIGVASAGIAFALQEVIVSIAGWISIMINGNISVGQRVKIGDIKGDIIDIGVLTTTIMEMGDWVDGDLYNGRIVTIANSFVFKQEIHNYSGEYPFLWDEIKIPIRTESDYELARTIFQEVLEEVCGDYAAKSKERWQGLAKKYRVETAQVEPMVSLAFDENWITFTLRYIVDFKRRRGTKTEIYTRALQRLKETKGAVEIANSTLEVTQG